MDNFNDCFEDLGNAVICQAANDYIKAKLEMKKSLDLLEELQDFFTGDCYKLFNTTSISGEVIMKRCDKIVEKNFKSWRKKHQKEMAAVR